MRLIYNNYVRNSRSIGSAKVKKKGFQTPAFYFEIVFDFTTPGIMTSRDSYAKFVFKVSGASCLTPVVNPELFSVDAIFFILRISASDKIITVIHTTF